MTTVMICIEFSFSFRFHFFFIEISHKSQKRYAIDINGNEKLSQLLNE